MQCELNVTVVIEADDADSAEDYFYELMQDDEHRVLRYTHQQQTVEVGQ